MQQNISSGLILVIEGDRRKFVHDENLPIYDIAEYDEAHLSLLSLSLTDTKDVLALQTLNSTLWYYCGWSFLSTTPTHLTSWHALMHSHNTPFPAFNDAHKGICYMSMFLCSYEAMAAHHCS